VDPRVRQRLAAALLVVSFSAMACAPHAAATDPPRALHPGLHANQDPTVRGARLVPEELDLAGATVEPSGSIRGVVQGARFRVDTRHAIQTAEDWIDDASVALPVPSRLGGGFLFTLGDTLYRADEWLARPRPFFRSARGVADVFVGLDRIYVKTKNGSHVGVDAKTGATLDLGPWPADPFVGAYAALDGWTALALTDIQGVVGTSDAGRSWNKVVLPIRAQAITPVRRDAEMGTWVEAMPDTPAEAFVVSDAPLLAARRPVRAAPESPPVHCELVSGALLVSSLQSCFEVTRNTGDRSPARFDASLLRAALEDGWPLEDGTALVAANGSVSRISLEDGAVVDAAPNAFDSNLGRCHAVSLGSVTSQASIGFVCGAALGRTTIFSYDSPLGRLRLIRQFGAPRLVQSSGNGGVLVLGACSDEPPTHASSTYCVGTRVGGPGSDTGAYLWREMVLPDAPGAVAMVTSDGRLARVEAQGAQEEARVTFASAGRVTSSVPLHLVDSRPAARRLLAHAVWLNELEERASGVLGGWLAADGTVVGFEIDGDGGLRLGPQIQELGSQFVAGRYGLGWTRSHRGYETTDGGMTWTQFIAPTALTTSSVRACGPAGCVSDGWLRVGWGVRQPETFPPLRPMPPFRGGAAESFRLACSTLEPFPNRLPHPSSPAPIDLSSMLGGTGPLFVLAGNFALATPSGNDASFTAPALTRADQLLHADIFQAFDSPHLGVFGRIYAWGPASGDWSVLGRWVTRWRSPFDVNSAVKSTMIAAAPFQDAEGARADMGLGRAGPVGFGGAVSEDATHALLMVNRNGRPVELLTLDEGGPSVPLRRADGAAWGLVDAAIRIGRDWFIAAPTDAHRTVIEILRAGDGLARRVANVPRLLATASSSTSPVRLARADDGGALGMVVDGEPAPDRPGARRWVVPVEIDSGVVGPPQPLGAIDLGDRAEVGVCDERGASGWTVDTTWPNPSITIGLGDADAPAYLRRVFARLRISSDRACVERLVGEVDDDALGHQGRVLRAPPSTGPTLPVLLVVTGPGPDRSTLLRCQRATQPAP
jgi:hypothetical protein